MSLVKQKKSGFTLPLENMSRNNKKEIGGLSDARIARFEQSVSRMNADLGIIRQNGVPKEYHKLAKDLCDHWMNTANYSEIDRKNAATTIAEEAFVLDREKARTYYDLNIAGQIFQPVTRALNTFKWDIKHYLIKKIANAVKFSRSFDSPRLIQVQTSSQMDKGVGWYVGYQISRWDLLETQGELFDIQYETMLEASAQMARTAHEHILTGTTIEHGGTDDMGEAGSGMAITGFINHASVQSHSVSTPSTWLNIVKGLKAGLTNLRKVYGANNIVMLTTGGLVSQAEANYSTYYDKTEKEEILQRYVGPDKKIKQWWSTDQLTGVAISSASSSQKMWLGNIDPRFMSRLIILPLQTLPSLKKNWGDDVSEVMIAADAIRYNTYDSTENAFPATACGSLTTSDIGYFTNERIA